MAIQIEVIGKSQLGSQLMTYSAMSGAAVVVPVIDVGQIKVIDTKTGKAPQRFFTERQGDDLVLSVEDQGGELSEFVLESYYVAPQPPAIVGETAEGLASYNPTAPVEAAASSAANLNAGQVVEAGTLVASETTFGMAPWIIGGLGMAGLAVGAASSRGGGDGPTNEPVSVTISVQGNAEEVKPGDTVKYVFEFSESVQAVDANMITVNGGRVVSVEGEKPGKSYTVTVQVDDGFEGKLGVSLDAGLVSSVSGTAVQGGKNDQVQVSSGEDPGTPENPDDDAVSLTISSAASNEDVVNGDTLFTFKFSREVDDFDISMIQVQGGYIVPNGLIDHGDGNYSLIVRPDAGATGTLTVSVEADSIDGLEDGASASVAFDTQAPDVEVSAAQGEDGNIVFTFTFSEQVKGFDADAVTITNGAKGTLTQIDDNTYTMIVTPDPDVKGEVTAVVSSSSGIADLAGNALDEDGSASIEVDTTPGVVPHDIALTIAHDIPAGELANDKVTFTFSFDREVTGFDAKSLSVTGGSIASVVYNGDHTYSVVVQPKQDTQGTLALTLDKKGISDADGNALAADADTSQKVTFDTQAPTVQVSGALEADGSVLFTFKFSEEVSGFNTDALVIDNGKAGELLAKGNNTYTLRVTPNQGVEGLVSASLATKNEVTDKAGNALVVNDDTKASVPVDTNLLQLSITDDVAGNAKEGDVSFVFSFNKEVVFDADQIGISNGSKKDFIDHGDNTYTLIVTPNENAKGKVTVSVEAGAVSDSSGKTLAGKVTHQVSFDTTDGSTQEPDLDMLLNLVDVTGKTGAVSDITSKVTGFQWMDVNGDGLMDLFVFGEYRSPSYLFQQQSDGSFVDVTQDVFGGSLNLEPPFAQWMDMNGNGHLDLVTLSDSRLTVYENNGDGTFTKHANMHSFSQKMKYFTHMMVGDFNGDGNQDILLLSSYKGQSYLLTSDGTTFINQSLSDFGLSALSNADSVLVLDNSLTGAADLLVSTGGSYIIYQNDGKGNFEVLGESLGGAPSNAPTPVWSGYNAEGVAYLFMPGGKNGANRLFEVTKDGGYVDVSESAGIQQTPAGHEGKENASQATWIDVDGDGHLDLLVVGSDMSALYRNNGDGTFTAVTGTGLVNTLVGYGASATYNEDGSVLIAVNGDGKGSGIQIYTREYDTFGTPELTITSDQDGTAFDTVVFTFSFSDPVTGFDQDDIVVKNGEKGAFTVIDANTYTLEVTPASGSTGQIDVSVPAGVAVNPLGNSNPASKVVSVPFDTTGEFLAVDIDVAVEGGGVDDFEGDIHGAAVFTFTFSKDVPDFSIQDITTKNLDIVAFHKISDTEYKLVALPKATGEMEVSIAQGVQGLDEAATASATVKAGDIKFINGSLSGITGLSDKLYAATWGDFDGDGLADLFIADKYSMALYKNNGDGTFTDVTSTVNLSAGGGKFKLAGAEWITYNEAGDTALLLVPESSKYGSPQLHIYDAASGTFSNISSQAGLPSSIGEASAIIAKDFNGTGTSDIAILTRSGVTLYQNNDGTFTKVYENNSSSLGGKYGQLFVLDVNNDGMLDMLVSDGYGALSLLKNQGDNNFDVISNLGLNVSGSIGTLAIADVYGDGGSTLMISDDAGVSLYTYNNEDSSFTKLTDIAGLPTSPIKHAMWIDLNGDGKLDLALIDNAGQIRLYQNTGSSGQYAFEALDTSALASVGSDVHDFSALDVNGDGQLDLIVLSRYGDLKVFQNDTALKLVGTGHADVLVGTSGDDVLIGNGGADIMLGGAGNDLFVLNADNLEALADDDQFALVDGGSGFDTLIVDGEDIELDLTAIATGEQGRIQSIEHFDITGTGDNTLVLSAQELRDLGITGLSDSGAIDHDTLQLMISGDAGDQVKLVDFSEWASDGASVKVGDVSYQVWNHADNLQLLIQEHVAVS